MSISITENAAVHVMNHLKERGSGIGVRLGVKTTGCSGLAYVIEFADKIDKDDKVFVDQGITEVKVEVIKWGDYGKEGINEGFKFDNPNAKDTCGCGESFNV